MKRILVSETGIVLAILAILIAVMAFFPLGGYRVLPTKYENCFTPDTPCMDLSGEQRE
jgi:hypothetical protein